MDTRYRGGCYCGAIRFEVDDFFDAGFCHCSICQRFSGAAAVAWAGTAARNFRITKGEPQAFASSPEWLRFFCPACGAPVYQCAASSPKDGEALYGILIPSLDVPQAVRPTVHMWCGSRPPFFEPGEDLPRFEDGKLSHPSTRASWRGAKTDAAGG